MRTLNYSIIYTVVQYSGKYANNAKTHKLSRLWRILVSCDYFR